MLAYLFLALSSAATYITPEYSASYQLPSQTPTVISSTNSSILLLSCTSISMIDLNLNLLFSYSLELNSSCIPVSIKSSNLVYALLNTVYSSTFSSASSSNCTHSNNPTAFLIILTLQGSLVRTQWIGECSFYSCSGLDLYLYKRLFIVYTCEGYQDSLMVGGINGEETVKVGKGINDKVSAKGYLNEIFILVKNETQAIIFRVGTQMVVKSISGTVLDFCVGHKVFIVYDSGFAILNYNGENFNYRQLGVIDAKVEFSASFSVIIRSLSGMYDIPQGLVALMQFDELMNLKSYRGYNSLQRINQFLAIDADFYFQDAGELLKSENPFSMSFIENCTTSTVNILGQATCSQCATGFTLLANHCIPNPICAPGSVNDIFTLTCTKCFSGCSACLSPSPTNCTSCTSTYNLLNNQCLLLCPSGYFASSGLCLKCSSNCASCTENQCYQCSSGYLINGMCQADCPIGTYKSSGNCTQCPQTCRNCTESGCLQCNTGFFLQSSQCVVCGKNCNVCTGGDQCSVCKDGFMLDSGSCYDCQNCKICAKGACSQCDDGYFFDNSTFRCKNCQANCSKCDSKACISCKSGFFGNSTGCYQCEVEFKNGTCGFCESGCKNCSEVGCFECGLGFYIKNMKCFRCPLSCADCEDPECLQCFPDPCLQKCSIGFQLVNNQCLSCPENCDHCNQTECTQCHIDFDAKTEYFLQNNSCTGTRCFSGYDLIDSICIPQNTESKLYLEGLLTAFLSL